MLPASELVIALAVAVFASGLGEAREPHLALRTGLKCAA